MNMSSVFHLSFEYQCNYVLRLIHDKKCNTFLDVKKNIDLKYLPFITNEAIVHELNVLYKISYLLIGKPYPNIKRTILIY